MRTLIVATLILVTAGCGMKPLEEQTKKSDKSIIGKTTTAVGVYDPNSEARVSDSRIQATDPVTAPMSAYGPMLERISKAQIEAAVNLFHAMEDRYPKDLDEFMQVIIRANNIQLPVLPGGLQYQYDVENHKLVIVEPAAAPASPAAPAAPNP